jgi:hypothetical protein
MLEIVIADHAPMYLERLSRNADISAPYLAIFYETPGDEFGGVYAYGEADPLSRGDDGGVDPYDITVSRNERAAGISGIKGGIGLNDIID